MVWSILIFSCVKTLRTNTAAGENMPAAIWKMEEDSKANKQVRLQLPQDSNEVSFPGSTFGKSGKPRMRCL